MAKTCEFKVGDKVTCYSNLSYEGITIPKGSYKIVRDLKSPGGKLSHFGIISNAPLMDWQDLSGYCDDGYGLWIDRGFMYKNFDFYEFGKKMIIKDKFVFKRRDLTGKKCHILGRLPRSKITFVEFDENVDGCSADGLGRAGHCVLVPHKLLEKAK